MCSVPREIANHGLTGDWKHSEHTVTLPCPVGIPAEYSSSHCHSAGKVGEQALHRPSSLQDPAYSRAGGMKNDTGEGWSSLVISAEANKSLSRVSLLVPGFH